MILEQIEELPNKIGDRMPATQVKPLNTEQEIKLLRGKVPLFSKAENAEARRRAAQLVNGGHGSVEWDNAQLCLIWEQK